MKASSTIPEEKKVPNDYPMSFNEFCSVSVGLEICHSVFYSLWDMVRPIFSYRVPTASVSFDPKGRLISMYVNPDYWDASNDHTKLFIIAHELTHVILYHGARALDVEPELRMIANIAADLCVNHMLVDSFGFCRDMIDNQENLMWLDTVFKEPNFKPEEIPTEYLTFEGYYSILKDKAIENFKNLVLVDDHSGLESFCEESLSGEAAEDLTKEIAKKVKSINSKEEIEDFLSKINEKRPKPISPNTEENKGISKNTTITDNKSIGCIGEPPIPGELTKVAFIKGIKIKPKWESVIKKWTSFILKDKSIYQWAREDRRYSSINTSTDISVPQLYESEEKLYEKIDIWFFLDTSGSCDHLRDRFLKAALSLNPKKFNVKLFSRTTEAKEVKPEDVMTMLTGGSDRFQCMEDTIHQYIASKKLKHYPHAIFHITDGHDCDSRIMTPLYPERWHFFITENGTTTRLPPKVNIHSLANYE